MPLTFGVYAGGLAATADGDVTPGPAEDPRRITAALDELHGTLPFLVRGYLHYSDAAPGTPQAPPEPWRYATGARRLDLVLCFREPGEDLTGWLGFIRRQIREHGDRLATIQITEEPENAGPGGDGEFPAVRRALIEGVHAAKHELARLGLDSLVGCNSTLRFDPEQAHWSSLKEIGDVVDYAGVDFFPDVFAPIPARKLGETTAGVLRLFREGSMAAAGIPPTVPMHVTEHGWPTGPGRPLSRQAEVLETVVRTVAACAAELNIGVYQHFALRDADSAVDDAMFRFGLMTSDYRPKPAFGVYRDLVREFGAAC
ncbi:hypothetical protein [Actinoplanes utahensis]|uniref:Uncharacterized protein n=1 Tax=Actinoplanes utahensis TaxID=1869 RepID=A0A0A6UXQ6_ACTUT|nr:hypothetical protein [Actinoplanes utahensis]KHD79204.1 hypothetical protein MB27_00845 [Actinoplanes utahensis]GIF30388.1 hypothetical protein Aut01nite_33740 [Actinoplanes utahensis]